jgi:hypothetical protein
VIFGGGRREPKHAGRNRSQSGFERNSSNVLPFPSGPISRSRQTLSGRDIYRGKVFSIPDYCEGYFPSLRDSSGGSPSSFHKAAERSENRLPSKEPLPGNCRREAKKTEISSRRRRAGPLPFVRWVHSEEPTRSSSCRSGSRKVAARRRARLLEPLFPNWNLKSTRPLSVTRFRKISSHLTAPFNRRGDEV